MIIAYVGLPGSGKTYAMSRDLSHEMRRNKRRVWANYPLKLAYFYQDFLQVLNVRKGIIAADELHMIAPARLFRSLPSNYFALWSQGRHMGIDFWYTTQNFHRVDVSIRNVTNLVWVCKRFFWKIHKMQLFDADDIERDRMRKKPLKTRWFIENRRIFRIYDSFYIVPPAKHLKTEEDIEDFDPNELPIFDADLQLIGSVDGNLTKI